MTAAVHRTVPRTVATAPRSRLILALARQEARRLLLHPLMVFGFFLFAYNGVRAMVAGNGPREAFEAVDSLVSFFPGVITILAANLVATRDRRSNAREMLHPLPGRPVERVQALVIAALAPAFVALIGVVALHGYFLLDSRYTVSPTVWHVLQGPVTVFGGCLFGILLASWFPFRGAAVVSVVAMVAANVWLAGLESGRYFGPMMTWPIWGLYAQDWAGVFPGSPMWHVVYLAGLCGMAGAAALLRVAERRAPVVVAGMVAVGVAVLGGIGQLP